MRGTVDPRRMVAEHAGRETFGKLASYLAGRYGTHAEAEDALSKALITALEKWPENGVPDNPAAWLLTVARRRLADIARNGGRAQAAQTHLEMVQDELESDAMTPADLPDRRLELMFTCTHPAIDRAVQAPLMLQSVLGFDAEAIGAAFLIPGNTMGQRLARAKNKIREAAIPFAVPEASERDARLAAVLDAIYVCYHAGWAMGGKGATAKMSEGIWLASILLNAVPDQPEVLGLNALLLYLDARRLTENTSTYIPLDERDTRAWDTHKISAADKLMAKAAQAELPGRFQMEAAIQSVHSDRARTGRTDWQAIISLYTVLARLAPSTGAAIGHAAALCLSGQPAEAIKMLDALDSKFTRDHQPYWAVRARALDDAGEVLLAVDAYAVASGLSHDPSEKAFLLGKMIEQKKNLSEM